MEQPASRPYAGSSPVPMIERANTSLAIIEADHDHEQHEQQGVSTEDWNQLQDLPTEDPVPIELPLQVDLPAANTLPDDGEDLYARRNISKSCMDLPADGTSYLAEVRESYLSDPVTHVIEQQRQAIQFADQI
eukprot:774439-Pyramimonas_sp.AAC.1